MAIVRKYLARDDYTKMDNNVARNTEISDYSYRLYGFMAGFRNGFQLNDMYIAKSLNWSRDKVSRAKRDLVKADLICIEKIDRSTYFLYIGSSKVKATEVKANWKELENGNMYTSTIDEYDGLSIEEAKENIRNAPTLQQLHARTKKEKEDDQVTAENIFD